MSSDRALDDAWTIRVAQAEAKDLIIPKRLDPDTETELRALGLVFSEASNENE